MEETFFRMLRHRELDVAEMSLSTYVAALGSTWCLRPNGITISLILAEVSPLVREDS